jgi:IS5 family transposase
VWDDLACQGWRAAIRQATPRARDLTNRRYRRGGWINERVKACNHRRSSMRAKVEHNIAMIERMFNPRKLRSRGLAKNLHWLQVSAAMASPVLACKRLLYA